MFGLDIYEQPDHSVLPPTIVCHLIHLPNPTNDQSISLKDSEWRVSGHHAQYHFLIVLPALYRSILENRRRPDQTGVKFRISRPPTNRPRSRARRRPRNRQKDKGDTRSELVRE